MDRQGGNYDNVRTKTVFLCCKKKLPWEEQPDRTIRLNIPDRGIGDNAVITNKYSLLDFLPLNLYEQFSKLANVYFLVCFTSELPGCRLHDDDSGYFLDGWSTCCVFPVIYHLGCEHCEEHVRRLQAQTVRYQRKPVEGSVWHLTTGLSLETRRIPRSYMGCITCRRHHQDRKRPTSARRCAPAVLS